MNEIIQTIAVNALPFLFAIVMREVARGYAARYFGDLTATAAGRLSMNPATYIHPIGTIVMPLVLFAITSGSFILGYAKPVPINFGNLRNPRKQLAWVVLSAPAVNFVMAFLWLVLAVLLRAASVDEPFFLEMAKAGVRLNLVLLAFNLLPIPPMDGGMLLISWLPDRLAAGVARIEPYGFIIVLALIYFKIAQMLIMPLLAASYFVLGLLVSPLTLLVS